MRIFPGSAFLLVLFLLLPPLSASASRLAVDGAPGTFGVAVGGDMRHGYFLAGFSAIFMDDFPWSYVPTRQSLAEPCQDYKSAGYYPADPADPTKGELAVDCDDTKGRFHDGEEWEVFGKFGFRVPGLNRLFLDFGMGVSHQKTADLYIFCNGIPVDPDPTKSEAEWRECERSSDFITWGKVRDHYYPTLMGGLGFEVQPNFLVSLDYHSRRGPLIGMTWKF